MNVTKAVLIALVGLALIGVLGLLVAASGLPRLTASGGHWTVTAMFLHFTTRRSIATWSIGVEAPPLEDPDLVVIGAGHYEIGCRQCHGLPGGRPPAVAAAMLPVPPDLSRPGRVWDDEDLYYIVLHGVKFAGMPSWPDLDRRDEVWPMVAFLRVLPELDRAGYEALVTGGIDPEEVPPTVRRCVSCHGADGLGRQVFPRLAEQRPEYLRQSLRAYVERERASGTMQTAADDLDPSAIEAATRWYASRPRGPAWPRPPDADLAHGEAIATGQVARVPGCVHCHGPGDQPRNPVFPRLDGQDPEYLAQQLRLFRKGVRGGTPYAGLMEAVAAHGLDDERIRDVTAWYATLAP